MYHLNLGMLFLWVKEGLHSDLSQSGNFLWESKTFLKRFSIMCREGCTCLIFFYFFISDPSFRPLASEYGFDKCCEALLFRCLPSSQSNLWWWRLLPYWFWTHLPPSLTDKSWSLPLAGSALLPVLDSEIQKDASFYTMLTSALD